VTDPAALRRRLIVELKRLRTQAKLTQRQVAEDLEWSPSKIIRIEQGVVGISITDLRAVLGHYGVTDEQTVEELAAMARGSKKQPFADYRDTFPADTIRYFGYEASAAVIRQVELNVVPGLLQTEEYTRALLAARRMDSTRIDKLVESRRERQELLERAEPPDAFFIVDEGALRRTIGGPSIMRRQLARLVQAAAQPHVSIQVLPFSIGAHPALAGSFVCLEFSAEDDPDLLYFENPLGDALFRDDAQLTATYRERFWELEDMATARESFEGVVSSWPI
jgi:transcriptional regulator with XRE-family HTH domain